MSLHLLDLYLSNATDARFRAWGSAISAAIQACGIVQTSDTGQINWTTINAPTGSTFVGYEIYRFADSIQSTTPCFFRIDYGANDDSGFQPSIQIQFSDSTNGAGLLTGQYSELFVLNLGSQSTTVTTRCVISGSTNRLQIAMRLNNISSYSGSTPMFFSIERDKDTSGNDTTLGFFLMCHNLNTGSNSNTRYQFVPHASLGVPQGSVPFNFISGNQPTGAFGTNVGLFPIYPALGYLLNPAMGSLLYFTGDIADNTSIAINVYGAAHTYFTVAPLSFNDSQSHNLSLAIRYE